MPALHPSIPLRGPTGRHRAAAVTALLAVTACTGGCGLGPLNDSAVSASVDPATPPPGAAVLQARADSLHAAVAGALTAAGATLTTTRGDDAGSCDVYKEWPRQWTYTVTAAPPAGQDRFAAARAAADALRARGWTARPGPPNPNTPDEVSYEALSPEGTSVTVSTVSTVGPGGGGGIHLLGITACITDAGGTVDHRP